jgi:anti-sigma regulatory factor (Ser/Thr protein kinase)
VLARLTVPSRVEFVRAATAFIVQSARALSVTAAAEPVFEVAISEAITNAVKHGGATDRTRATITCELDADESAFTLRIIDDGSGFDVGNKTLPDVSRERIESLPASGYGLPIIHTVFPSVRVVNVDGRFALELSLPTAPVKL